MWRELATLRDLMRLLNKPLECLTFPNFLVPLALRLYLAPMFWVAGSNELQSIEGTIFWFGSSNSGLGLPLPALLAGLATLTEAIGAALLIIGLGVRWISLPLVITMRVAAFTVHWQNGWLAINEKTVFCH